MSFNTLEYLIAATASGVRPPERLTVAEAAEKYRYLNNPGSYVGYWDNSIAPYLVEPMEVLTSLDYIGMVFVGPARTGKALALDTPVPTPTGWTTMGDIQPGDTVLAATGEPTKVMFVSGVMHGHACARVTFVDAEAQESSIVADMGHRWEIRDCLFANPRVLTTSELLPGMTVQDHRAAFSRRWVISAVESVESVPVQCIGVEHPSHLFLAGTQMVPTHNSDMFFNWLCHTAKCDPADMMHVLMTQNVARDWSQKDLRRAFRHSIELGKTVKPGRQNMATHSIGFLSGMHLLVKWPTITELSGKTVGRNWISDYDRIPESIDGEGNAYDLTAKRGQTFRRHAMTVAESSPGFEIEDPKWVARTKHEAPPTKGILALYNRGDRRRWFWKCPHCKGAFEPDFKLLQWPDSHDHVESAEEAFMACPHCGGIMWHDERHGVPGKNELNQISLGNARWVRDGQIWRPEENVIEGTPYRSDIASFWMKGPAAAFTTWRDLVLKYLKADEEYERTGSQEALKTTINTDQGLPFMPRGLDEGRNWEDVKSTARDLGIRVVPAGVRFLVATVDVQAGRFEVQVMGFGYGGDITVIDRFAIKKSERLDEDGERERVKPATYVEDWHLLIDKVILKSYPLADGSGRHMSIKAVGCDSGGAADKKNDSSTTKTGYQFWRDLRDSDGSKFPAGLHNRFRLLKGGSEKLAPRVKLSYPDSERKDRTAGARGEIPILMLNTLALKDQLNAMMDRKSDGGGRINFPDWLPDDFFQELVAEVRAADGWLKVSTGARNEAWDLLIYAIAIALHRPIKIEHLDWDDGCPGWAAEWDKNDLVFQLDNSGNPVNQVKKEKLSLADLAALLA